MIVVMMIAVLFCIAVIVVMMIDVRTCCGSMVAMCVLRLMVFFFSTFQPVHSAGSVGSVGTAVPSSPDCACWNAFQHVVQYRSNSFPWCTCRTSLS